jgi:hypothetical protein
MTWTVRRLTARRQAPRPAHRFGAA